jgi:hypothetical protein
LQGKLKRQLRRVGGVLSHLSFERLSCAIAGVAIVPLVVSGVGFGLRGATWTGRNRIEGAAGNLNADLHCDRKGVGAVEDGQRSEVILTGRNSIRPPDFDYFGTGGVQKPPTQELPVSQQSMSTLQRSEAFEH